METLSSPDVAVVQTRIQNRSTLIISAYLDIQNKEVIPDVLTTAVEYALRKGLAIIIGMDSNAHSTSFGPVMNSRGEILDLFIAKYGLDIENRGNTPTFCGRGCATFIDITLTRGLSVTVKEWEVCTDYNGSDHNTIKFYTDMDYETIESTWKWQDADWDKFQSLLKSADINIPHIIYQKDCDQLLTKYYKLIYQAMKQSIPKNQPKIIDKNNPWWTPQLKQQRKTVSKLYRTATRFPSERNKNRYKFAQKQYAKGCDKTRDRSCLLYTSPSPRD